MSLWVAEDDAKLANEVRELRQKLSGILDALYEASMTVGLDEFAMIQSIVEERDYAFRQLAELREKTSTGSGRGMMASEGRSVCGRHPSVTLAYPGETRIRACVACELEETIRHVVADKDGAIDLRVQAEERLEQLLVNICGLLGVDYPLEEPETCEDVIVRMKKRITELEAG